jgi:hypothetical protein
MNILIERYATARGRMSNLGTKIPIPIVWSGAIHLTARRIFYSYTLKTAKRRAIFYNTLRSAYMQAAN